MLKKRITALFAAMTVLTLSLVSILPSLQVVNAATSYVFEENSGEIKTGNWDVTMDQSANNVKELALADLGITESDTINKIEVNVTQTSATDWNQFTGFIGVSAKDTYANVKDGCVAYNDGEGNYEIKPSTTSYTLSFELSKEQSDGVWSGTGSVIHIGYWYGPSPEITLDEVRVTVNGTYTEVTTEDPDYITVLEGGTTVQNDVARGGYAVSLAEGKTPIVEIPIADLGVTESDTINKVDIKFTNAKISDSPRFNGRIGFSAKADFTGNGSADSLVAAPQIDADQTNPCTISWELSPEEAAGVDNSGFLQIALWWTQVAAVAEFAVVNVDLVINGEYVQIPIEKEPVDDSQYVDYATALQQSLYIYDANYCGPLAGESSALTWRDDCHTNDIFDITIDGVTYEDVDLTGGFHDAGDHVKFGLPAAYSAFTLGLAYNQFPGAFDQTKQTDHLQSITDYFADYFKKSIIRDADGKVVSFVYQVGTGDPDHAYWGAPEDQDNDGRIPYYTTDKNLAADIVGGTIAALAMNYINFGNEEDLQAAKDLWNYMHQYYDVILNDESDNSDDLEVVSVVKEYTRWEDDTPNNRNNPWDYLSLGSVALNMATGTTDYNDFKDPKGISANKSYFAANWDGVWPYFQVLDGQYDGAISRSIPGVGTEYTTAFNFVQKWGSARLNSNLQFTALMLDKNMGTENYQDWARGQMDYLFGKNADKQAYIVGYDFREDVKYPLYPHHRAADGSTTSPGSWNENWYDSGSDADGDWTKKDSVTLVQTPEKNILVGALVGGPENVNGAYADSLNNYIGNEVAIDYQAGFIGSLAALYLAFQNDNGATLLDLEDIPGVKTENTEPTQPTEPTEPTQPTEPTEPSTPGNTGNGWSPSATANGNTSNSGESNPETGDVTGTILPIALSIIFSGVALVAHRRKK
jgi:hypothetical protein